jgi:hypothetical protein
MTRRRLPAARGGRQSGAGRGGPTAALRRGSELFLLPESGSRTAAEQGHRRVGRRLSATLLRLHTRYHIWYRHRSQATAQGWAWARTHRPGHRYRPSGQHQCPSPTRRRAHRQCHLSAARGYLGDSHPFSDGVITLFHLAEVPGQRHERLRSSLGCGLGQDSQSRASSPSTASSTHVPSKNFGFVPAQSRTGLEKVK